MQRKEEKKWNCPTWGQRTTPFLPLPFFIIITKVKSMFFKNYIIFILMLVRSKAMKCVSLFHTEIAERGGEGKWVNLNPIWRDNCYLSEESFYFPENLCGALLRQKIIVGYFSSFYSNILAFSYWCWFLKNFNDVDQPPKEKKNQGLREGKPIFFFLLAGVRKFWKLSITST